eukprot:4246912-Pyramimonas_sp.AAC.1
MLTTPEKGSRTFAPISTGETRATREDPRPRPKQEDVLIIQDDCFPRVPILGLPPVLEVSISELARPTEVRVG